MNSVNEAFKMCVYKGERELRSTELLLLALLSTDSKYLFG